MKKQLFLIIPIISAGILFTEIPVYSSAVDKTEKKNESVSSEDDRLTKNNYKIHPAIADGLGSIHVVTSMGIIDLHEAPIPGFQYDEMILSPGQKTIGHGDNVDIVVKNDTGSEAMADKCPVISYMAYPLFSIDNGLDSSYSEVEIHEFYGTDNNTVSFGDMTGRFHFNSDGTVSSLEVR